MADDLDKYGQNIEHVYKCKYNNWIVFLEKYEAKEDIARIKQFLILLHFCLKFSTASCAKMLRTACGKVLNFPRADITDGTKNMF